MMQTIELDQIRGYKYSFMHKSLIYCPSQENQLINDSIIDYKKKLLKLYRTSEYEEKVQFTKLMPQMIENAIVLTNQIVFEVTENCNLSCTYCGYGDIYKQASKKRCNNMKWQTAKTVLDFYIQKWKEERPKKLKKYCFIGFYGGEPLLNMQLIKKIISYVEKHGENLEFSYNMTTNGTLLQENIEYLIEKNFTLIVSLDGDREMNSFRVYKNGKEVYNKIFSNLKKIQKEHTNYFESKIEFLSVATNRNTNKGITSFFDKEFSKSPEIHQLSSNMIADYDKWNSICRKKEHVEKEDVNNHNLNDYLKLFSGNFYDHYRSLLDDSKKIVKMPTGTCMPFSIRVLITAKEKIIACERIGFEHTLGSITDRGIEIDFESIANFYNNLLNKFKVHCEYCCIKETCDVCALSNDEYFKENFKCEEFYPISRLKNCISESIKILRKGNDFNTINYNK